MLARRYGLIVVFLLIPVEARAHLHKAGAFFGPSFDQGSRLNGITLGGEFMLPKTVKNGGDRTRKTSWRSVFLSTSTNWGKHNGGDRTQFGLSLGLRATYAIPPLDKTFEVYGHAVGAFVHTQDSKADIGGKTVEGKLGAGVGAGVTVDLSRPFGLKKEVVARVQYDHLWVGGDVRRYKLVSVGIEYRFGSYAKAHATASTVPGPPPALTGDR